MKRRMFIGLASIAALSGLSAPFLRQYLTQNQENSGHLRWMQARADVYEDTVIDKEDLQRSIALIQSLGTLPGVPEPSRIKGDLGEYLTKVRNFDHNFIDDFYLSADQLLTLVSVYSRLSQVKKVKGHGKFSVISFDNMLSIARNSEEIGAFTQKEKDFTDMLFHEDAKRYGFKGKKLITNLTYSIARRSLDKVRESGQYVYKGASSDLYHRIRSDIGNSIILTSGVRGVPKQVHLFLGKVILTEGNLSRASRSIAPPGYSYHGVGDFDVGKLGYGMKNFTSEFTDTWEYKKLRELDYVSVRYPEDNLLGVRYEPWHVKVA